MILAPKGSKPQALSHDATGSLHAGAACVSPRLKDQFRGVLRRSDRPSVSGEERKPSTNLWKVCHLRWTSQSFSSKFVVYLR